MIGVSFYGNNIYMNPIYTAQRVSAVGGVDRVQPGRVMPDASKVDKSAELKGPKECKTCERRKYKDGSDENDVSFQTPQHIDPANSMARVLGHEMEHVANAREEGMKDNKELISATVSLKIGVCPSVEELMWQAERPIRLSRRLMMRRTLMMQVVRLLKVVS